MTNVQSTTQLNLREKLLAEGVEGLSDNELLAVFISSGSRTKSCMQLATDLVTHLGDLRAILNADSACFNAVSGLGLVRYVQLQAVREMCRRSDFIDLQKNVQITDSGQTFSFLKKNLRDYKNEIFAVLFLDNQHRVISFEKLFTGTINATTVHARPIIERALQLNAAAVILAHNHPSGVSDASQEDYAVTKRLQEALSLVDVRLLDHIVIGDNEVYSILAEMKWRCHR